MFSFADTTWSSFAFRNGMCTASLETLDTHFVFLDLVFLDLFRILAEVAAVGSGPVWHLMGARKRTG